MHRPTRTRRLSIAAMASLLAFVAVAGAGVRSFWNSDWWESGTGRWGISLVGGCAIFNHHSGITTQYTPTGYFHIDVTPDRSEIMRAVWGFRVEREAVHFKDGSGIDFFLYIPLWPFLLLLFIAPMRWLVGRPANRPAFPVVTKLP